MDIINSMRVFRFTNKILSSNTYILSYDNKDGVYVIDPGDSFPIFGWLKLHNKFLLGVFLTHAHFDHIYGLNDILNKFSDIPLYITLPMVDGLFSAKLNTSLYHEKPFMLNNCHSRKFIYLEEGNTTILWKGDRLFVLFTPGHTVDSISFKIDNYLFSGDALIPGKKVFTRKKMSVYEAVPLSIEKIYCTFAASTILLPGHGKEYLLGETKSIKDFCGLKKGYEFMEILV